MNLALTIILPEGRQAKVPSGRELQCVVDGCVGCDSADCFSPGTPVRVLAEKPKKVEIQYRTKVQAPVKSTIYVASSYLSLVCCLNHPSLVCLRDCIRMVDIVHMIGYVGSARISVFVADRTSSSLFSFAFYAFFPLNVVSVVCPSSSRLARRPNRGHIGGGGQTHRRRWKQEA